MPNEENIKQELLKKFGYLDGKINIQRARRIFVDVEPEKFPEVFDYMVKILNCTILCAITGLDEITKLGVIYHVAQENGIVINIKISIAREKPVMKSIIPYFPSAENYERELVDLFGINVTGLPKGNRYPLTDDWPKGEYPLRKDWKKPI